jgi:polyketide biosynthesis enoyl-CoA hydratase PksH
MNNYTTIEVSENQWAFYIRLNRPDAGNSINGELLHELSMAISEAEKSTNLKVIVLEGNSEVFCTGMDFNAMVNNQVPTPMAEESKAYYELLRQMTICSKIMIARVEGKVNAGGVGIVAACDIVIAGEQATFGLSETLFGLLPACVLPFLIRRIGIQKAQWMALSTHQITAKRAYEIGLVDELADNTADVLRRNLLRVTRLETETILDLKTYLEKLWIMDAETQQLAVNKITSLVNSEKVQANIKNYILNDKFPWSK